MRSLLFVNRRALYYSGEWSSRGIMNQEEEHRTFGKKRKEGFVECIILFCHLLSSTTIDTKCQ